MYLQKLKQKALLLICLTGLFVTLLAVRSDRLVKDERSEEGEELVIPKEEEEPEILIVPEEVFVMPEADEPIRVLLLEENGGIYHDDKELDKEYPGELQYYEEEEGWVIVNEVPLEEYLRRVVPSEMPSGYASEALKAQAVCARTYAVWHMQGYAYPEYEAHVDDSVSYQVYNNIESQETTDHAIVSTEGQILLYDEKPVKAYYFATSCGSTTDEHIWEKGDPEQTPYIAGRRINTSVSQKDLTDEEAFSRYIRKKHAGDVEISEPWYRWNCFVPFSQIERNVAKSAETVDIGEIEKAQIVERNTGGAVQRMLLTGEDGTLEIEYEYNIRQILGIPGGQVHKNDGTIDEGGNLLPSGYFVLEPVEEDGELTGYQVFGGGLGHGAGMSQNGARILAEQGNNYEEILKYFYKGVYLARLE